MNPWTRLTLVTAPDPTGVVTLDQAKAHLRVDDGDNDANIMSCLRAAIARFDGPRGIGVCLATQTWRLRLDGFRSCIDIPLTPVQSISTLTYVDTDGAEQVLSSASWQLDTGGETARLVPAFGQSWPACRAVPGSVKIDFVAGSPAADINPALVAGVKMLLGHYYANREAVSDVDMRAVPLGVQAIMDQFRNGVVA